MQSHLICTGDASSLINWSRQVAGAMSIGIFTSFFYTRMAFYGKVDGASPESICKGIGRCVSFGNHVDLLKYPVSLIAEWKTGQYKREKLEGKDIKRCINVSRNGCKWTINQIIYSEKFYLV